MGVPIRVLASGIGLCAMLGAASARAEQFLLFDVEFTYTWQDAINSSPSQSHYYVNDDNVLNTERPDDWLSPVDFRNGTLHVRLEVIDKPPGDQTANWTLCYIANEGGYGCAQTGVYTSEGVFESDVAMTDWWNNEVIDWSQGIKQMDLIYKKSTAGLDHVHFFPELEPLLTPTTVRITMVQVADGDTYDPSALGLDFATGGAGGTAGAGGDQNAGGAGGSTSLTPGGEGGVGGSGGAGNGVAGAAVAGTSGSAGSAGAQSPSEIAGAAGSLATPTAAAGAAIVDPIPSAGSEGTPPSQPPSSNVDSSRGCAIQRGAGGHRACASLGLLLAALLIRRTRRAAHDDRRASARSTAGSRFGC
jgi:hypothetical protein